MPQKYSTKRKGRIFVHRFFPPHCFPPFSLFSSCPSPKGHLPPNSWLHMLQLSSFHSFGENREEEKQSLWFGGDRRIALGEELSTTAVLKSWVLMRRWSPQLHKWLATTMQIYSHRFIYIASAFMTNLAAELAVLWSRQDGHIEP